uniref:Uncharacterized protein n=1 Tax=Rhizophora mucronata TaxID=61149 RepID=A0A2P2M8B1_RHIMU
MANKFKQSSRDTVHDPAPLRLGRRSGLPGTFFVNPNYIKLKNVAGGDNKIRNCPDSAPRRQFRFKIVGLNSRDLRNEVRTGMRDEAGAAVLYAGGAVHHLAGRKAHRRGDYSTPVTLRLG